MRVQRFDQMGAALVALGGGHAGAGMDTGVVDTLQPEGELGVEFFHAVSTLAGQAQAGFKILLDGENDPLGFSLRPGMIRLGVKESDAQVGTDDPSMVIGERTALVGIEFGGQAAAAQSFLESMMEGLSISPQAITGKGNETGMVVNDHTQEGGHSFGPRGGGQIGAGGKVRHPQVVDKRRLEAL